MIIAFLKNKRKKYKVEANSQLPKNTIWLDLIKPSIKEEKYIEKILKVEAPTEKEIDQFEMISPFYKDKNVEYMTVTILDILCETYPESTAITFILTQKYLITTRYSNLKSFEYMNLWTSRNKIKYITSEYILITITDFIINCSADIFEKVGEEINNLLKIVFDQNLKKKKRSNEFYNNIIRRIGYTGTIISNNKESLTSMNRMIIYFTQIEKTKYIKIKNYRLRIKHIFREIISLGEYANFLSQRNSFLLDATLGMISVEHNIITKVFTVVTAVFMPPTMIAAIYGMNFRYMPELSFKCGYVISLIIIIISALIPYLYFKKKRWI